MTSKEKRVEYREEILATVAGIARDEKFDAEGLFMAIGDVFMTSIEICNVEELEMKSEKHRCFVEEL